jgi:DNA sulfur modification protein DndD
MQFKSLEIENFGPFRGKHSFDLRIENSQKTHRPIIIIGGKNGTGKTSLLDALKICLYGNYFRGKRMPERMYKKFLQQRLHRCRDGTAADSASITVEFDYSQSGHVDNYVVKRVLKNSSHQIIETLEIRQNNKPLQDVDEDQWQDFLLELIPPGLSKLFFFDGEQIQNLAKAEGDNKYIVSAIDSLLGLDIIERLQSDLRIYSMRKSKAIDRSVEEKFLEYQNKKKSLESRLDFILQEKANLRSKIRRIEEEIESQERRIAMEGGSFGSKREQLKIQIRKIDEDIEKVKEEIRELCSDLLPFAFVPDLCVALRDRLRKEEKEQQRAAALTFLTSILGEWEKDFNVTSPLSSIHLPQQQKLELVRMVMNELRSRIESMNNLCPEIIHPISSVERNEILGWIDITLNDIPIHLRQLSLKLEKLVRDRQKKERFLYSAPSDDVLNPLFKHLGKLHEELGVLQEQYRSLEEEANKTNNELNQVIRALTRSADEIDKVQRISERLTMVTKIKKILEEYQIWLREEKIKLFCQNFLECFSFLFNKKDFIQKVSVDSDSFNIILIGEKDTVIPKSELSAGERQIYAIALLWALARTSGRQLPFIIDTPLARLDTGHRKSIVNKFLHNASHQVILFSTDTEIDQAYFNDLQSYISKAYLLEFDTNQQATRVMKGYFWKPKEELIVYELQ